MQKNTFYSQVHMEHSPGPHMGHTSSFSKFKKIEIVLSIFSDHNTMRLDINYIKKQKNKNKNKKTAKSTDSWRLNNTLLNNKQFTEEMKREIKRFLETNDNENMMTQNLWDAANAFLRGKFIAIQSYLKKWENSQTT